VSADFRQLDIPTLGADPISRADRDSRCTSNLLEFGFRFLEEYHSWLPFLSAVIRKPDGGIHRFPLYGKESCSD